MPRMGGPKPTPEEYDTKHPVTFADRAVFACSCVAVAAMAVITAEQAITPPYESGDNLAFMLVAIVALVKFRQDIFSTE